MLYAMRNDNLTKKDTDYRIKKSNYSQVCEDDALPLEICLKCVTALEIAHQLRKTAALANEDLKRFFNVRLPQVCISAQYFNYLLQVSSTLESR